LHPQVAGVTIPTVIIIGLMVAPFIDRNPSTRPDDRKLAIVIFSFFMLSFAVLTIIGMFFRGPGFNFVLPWEGGIFFEL
ncbi:MAG: menaquinol-cytochrome c reductase cytochrome b subunit, partial [Actinomycetota bacterium]|nr:menaquinol-cytochrome c reductase cytochrome b subunit [Actinomycetota bacterium]